MATVDNKLLIIPNKSAWGETITNFTGSDVRRVDLVFGIGYEDDIQNAIDVLKTGCVGTRVGTGRSHSGRPRRRTGRFVCQPVLPALGQTADYWTVHWDLTHQVKVRFDAEGISIPFPQRDVHMHTVSTPV